MCFTSGTQIKRTYLINSLTTSLFIIINTSSPEIEGDISSLSMPPFILQYSIRLEILIVLPQVVRVGCPDVTVP